MEKRKNNKKVLWIIVLIILVIALAVALFIKFKGSTNDNAEPTNNSVEGQAEEPEKPITIVDVNSKTRPYAVMINNNHDAWPHAGLQDAYLVYEIVAEGGITRMMALFKDQETAKIGSVRSSRPYYIDYALENDAIYVHYGASTQAYSILRGSDTDVDYIDGMTVASCFWRDTSLNKAYEHTAFTSLDKVTEYAEKNGYTRDTNQDLLLNYTAEEVDLSTLEGAIPATDITIEYSYYHTTSYEYDEENKVYKRSMSGTKHVDAITDEQYTAKNIIIYDVGNSTINDGSGKGRQELDNTGTGKGYYVTNGYAVPITWEKEDFGEQTVYKYETGEEIEVSDGNTYIQIYPTGMDMEIE